MQKTVFFLIYINRDSPFCVYLFLKTFFSCQMTMRKQCVLSGLFLCGAGGYTLGPAGNAARGKLRAFLCDGLRSRASGIEDSAAEC